MADSKPFFSRNQLNVIILVSMVAILVLSTGGGIDYPTLHRRPPDGGALYWTAPVEGQHAIRLSFALPPDSPEAVRALAYGQLRRRLLAAPAAFGTAVPVARDFPDRFVVGLNAADPDALRAALPTLLDRLDAPQPPAVWTTAWRRLQAERYLAGQAPPPAAPADPPGRAAALDAALYRRHLSRISLLGDEPALVEAAARVLRQRPPGPPWPAAPEATSPSGLNLPGRRSPAFPATLLALRLLQPLAAADGVRLRWQPLGDRSRLAADPPSALPPLLDRLAATDRAPLEQAKQRLLEELKGRLDDPAALTEELETIAFYDLPLDYLPTFAATIEALTPESFGALVRRWPQP